MFKTWEELTVREQLQATFWDLYKDAYGFRPRSVDIRSMTTADLEAEVARLHSVVDSNIAVEREQQQEAVAVFEALVSRTIALGASDRETALLWIMDGSDCQGDWEFLCWQHDLPYGYFKKEVDLLAA